MEITVRVSRTGDDLNKAFKMSRRGNAWMRWSGILLIIVILSFIAIPAIWHHSGMTTSSKVALFISFLIWSVLIYYYMKGLGARMLKKNPGLGREEEVTFSEEGIRSVTATGRSQGTWSNYTKAVISADILLIYPNHTAFLCYPSRVFSEGDYTALCQLVRAKIADTREL